MVKHCVVESVIGFGQDEGEDEDEDEDEIEPVAVRGRSSCSISNLAFGGEVHGHRVARLRLTFHCYHGLLFAVLLLYLPMQLNPRSLL